MAGRTAWELLFIEPKRQESGAPGPIRKDEAILSYVAVTRALGGDTHDNEGIAWISEYRA
ncbi:hypothetical protein ACWDBD_50425 [Streptomyces sp. NPDC001118]